MSPTPRYRAELLRKWEMIDCYKCKYYYVTWDKHFPHGCKAMKFKSKQFPSTVVFVSSNKECLLFKKKKRKTSSKDK